MCYADKTVVVNVAKRFSDRCHTCDSNADCINKIGSFECPCLTGFTGDGSGTCSDIDECNDVENADKCDRHASCENTVGSFSCECDDGFIGDGLKCENINECEDEVRDPRTQTDRLRPGPKNEKSGTGSDQYRESLRIRAKKMKIHERNCP